MPDSECSQTVPLSAACPCRQWVELLEGKWSLLVLLALRQEPRRFSELRRALKGISEKVLTATLRELERKGLLLRNDFQEVPPRVEYFLTPLGAAPK